MLTRARVCSSFQTGTNPVGQFITVFDGSVALDGKGDVRSTLDLTVDGTRKWPQHIDSAYAPYGNEIYIERGVELSDALVEYVGLGYHRIETPEQAGISDNPIRITAVDRMQGIIEARLLTPQQFIIGTTLGTVVTTLVQQVYPTATIEWDDATFAVPLVRSLIAEDDRYGFINDLVASRGKIWYWDHRGILVIKDAPPVTSVSFEVHHAAYGTLVDLKRVLTREQTYNAVVASGEAPDTNTPVTSTAIDDDASSPTYFYGRFGQKPFYYTSQFLTTEAQCLTAAEALLHQLVGLSYSISFGTIVNPALEPYDVVRLKFSHNEPPQLHVLDTVDIPLTEGGVLSSNSRERRVTLAP
jgi:hypothetical protein